MLKSALMNELIPKHPVNGVRYTKPARAKDDIKFLTIDEQKKFLVTAKCSHNYYQYALILETGLRTGELIGLTSDAIDWKNRMLSVNKTLEFRHKQKDWRAGPPKTQKGSETLSKELEYMDRRTGEKSKLVMSDLVLSTLFNAITNAGVPAGADPLH